MSGASRDSFERLLHGALEFEPLRWRAGQSLASGRFELVGRIGEGGMGVVYEAIDRERQGTVALKAVARLDPNDTYRLKNEFRGLCSVQHRNLVQLHELFAEQGAFFFTMELVRGQHIDTWVRPHGKLHRARLRAGLAQLVEAVIAIHEAGKLHRDLKPSNALVTPDGRVVVLDFGLVSDQDLGGVGQTVPDGALHGTPAYVSPEQSMGEPATPASDFYALGVMLFEALTGTLPFTGRSAHLIAAKQSQPAPRPADHDPTIPADLAALCERLLATEPADRPCAQALRACLSRDPSVRRPRGSTRRAASTAERADRATQQAALAALCPAYEAMLGGQAVVAFVEGSVGQPGAALERVVSKLCNDSGALLLRGRCSVRERVPFRALDPLIDDLTRHLRRVSARQLPADIAALVALFPVLQRVEGIREALRTPEPSAQSCWLRAQRAFNALLADIRSRSPLIVLLDGLHFLDRDSSLFLGAWLGSLELVPALVALGFEGPRVLQREPLAHVRAAALANPSCRSCQIELP